LFSIGVNRNQYFSGIFLQTAGRSPLRINPASCGTATLGQMQAEGILSEVIARNLRHEETFSAIQEFSRSVNHTIKSID
jgi:hypothetical protein